MSGWTSPNTLEEPTSDAQCDPFRQLRTSDRNESSVIEPCVPAIHSPSWSCVDGSAHNVASHHRADATVFGLAATGGRGGGRWGAVVVGAVLRMSGMLRMRRVAPVAVLCVGVRWVRGVRGVGRLLAVGGGGVVLMGRVL